MRRDSYHLKMLNNLKESSFHGIPEIIKSPSKTTKIFWTLLLVCSLGMVIYEILRVILEYKTHPISSQYSRLPSETLQAPLLILCPTNWINQSAVEDVGLSRHQLAALLFLTDGGRCLNQNENDEMRQISLNQSAYNRAFEELREMAKTQGLPEPLVFELGRKIAKKPWKLFRFGPESFSRNILTLGYAYKDIQFDLPYVEGLGLCYSIKFPPLNDVNFLKYLDIRFYMVESSEQDTIGADLALYIDTDSSCQPDTAKEFLDFGMEHKIIVEYKMEFDMVSSKKNPCKQSWTRADQLISEATCKFHKFREGPNCTRLDALLCGVPYQPDLPICHSEVHLPLFPKNCPAKYPNPCIRTFWTYRISSLQHRFGANVTMFNVHLSRPFEYLKSKENWTYSWDTLLSNIGGQFGLWLGASLVSIFQLLQIGFLACFHRCLGSSGKSNDVNMAETVL